MGGPHVVVTCGFSAFRFGDRESQRPQTRSRRHGAPNTLTPTPSQRFTAGPPVQVDKVISSTTFTTKYFYNLASELTKITYPSNRDVLQNFDAIGRLCAVGATSSTCTSGTRYAYGFAFNTAQEVTGFTYGNGITANLSYSADRLQLQCLQYATVSVSDPCTKDSTAIFMLTYGYGSSGSNNGQITGITDGMDSGRTASYSYDALGRLSAASTSGSSAYPAWGLSWSYDRYGNRTAQTITAGSAFLDTETYGTTAPNNGAYTNRTDGHSYDASGNMTSDGWNTLTYDAASHLISAVGGSSSGAYSYDGNGLRVKKSVPSTSPTITTVYIFSGTKVIAEYENGAAVGSPTREYIYSGGTMIAKIAGSTTTYFQNDHLSNRVVTDSSGNVVEQLGHYPFGENWYDTGNEKHKFTTYERDSESGNDFAMARHNVSRLGRFSSPDPLSGSIYNPQSLDRYTYAWNDPINIVDPSGMEGMFFLSAPDEGIGQTDSGFDAWKWPDYDYGGGGASGKADVTKPFGKTFDCNTDAAGVISAIDANFSQFGNYHGKFNIPLPGIYGLATVEFGSAAVAPGNQISIYEQTTVIAPSGGSLPAIINLAPVNVSVTVASSSATGFTFTSNPGHVLYPATISFSATNVGNGQISFSINVSGQFSSFLNMMKFKYGGDSLEDNIWNNFIKSVLEFCNKKK